MIPKCIQIVMAIAAISIYGTSGQLQCLTSTNVSCVQGDYRGRFDTVETRLLFSMNFTCHGTIVGWTVTGRKVENRNQYPELQIWQADPRQGLDYYYKPGQDIPVNPDGPACEIVTQTCDQIFQCRLREANHVSVEPGDILGVEIPQLTNSGFLLYFISIPGTQDHYIFRRQLSSSVTISSDHIRQLDDNLLISLEIEPGTASTTAPTTNAPTTTTTDLLLITESTTTEGANGTSTTDAQQPTTTINTIKDALSQTCNQSTAPGLITGVAVGGVVMGALLTLTATLILVVIARLTKNKQSKLTLLAENKTMQGEDEMKDMEMKNVEEPVYSVILSNPTASNYQIEMNMNECYTTACTNAVAPS